MKYIELDKICYIINKGKSVVKNDNGNIYMVGFTNIENNAINFEKTSKCNLVNAYMDLKIYDIEENDILLPPITRKNLVIKQLLTLENSNNMIYSSRAVYIRVNQEKYLSQFLYYILSTQKYKEKLLKEVYTDGSYVDTYQISIERLKDFKVPDISIEEQKSILNSENKIKTQIQELENQLKLLYKNL